MTLDPETDDLRWIYRILTVEGDTHELSSDLRTWAVTKDTQTHIPTYRK